MEYYSVIKRNDVLIHTTWMDIENISCVKEAIAKDHMLYDSMYMNVQDREIHRQKGEKCL